MRHYVIERREGLAALAELLRSNDPIDYKTARRVRDMLCEAWHTAREASKFGYDPLRARELEVVIALIPSSALNIYTALNSGDLSVRLWGGGCYARARVEAQAFVTRLLRSRLGINEHMAAIWDAALARCLESRY